MHMYMHSHTFCTAQDYMCSALTSTASQPKKRPVLSLASTAALLWFIYMHAGLLATRSVGRIKDFIVNAFDSAEGES